MLIFKRSEANSISTLALLKNRSRSLFLAAAIPSIQFISDILFNYFHIPISIMSTCERITENLDHERKKRDYLKMTSANNSNEADFTQTLTRSRTNQDRQ